MQAYILFLFILYGINFELPGKNKRLPLITDKRTFHGYIQDTRISSNNFIIISITAVPLYT